MNYEILSLETAEKLAKANNKENAKKIKKAIKMLEYYVKHGDNIILNGNALKPILAVLRGENENLQ